MPSQHLLRSWSTPNGHRLAEVRLVRFADHDVLNASSFESISDHEESLLVRNLEHHGVGACVQLARTGLASCVNKLTR